MNIYLESYGCSANQNNTEIMAGLLSRAGFGIVKNPAIADIAVLNTCIVKSPTEKRMERRIQELSKKFKFLVVAGCMPDVMQEKIKLLAPKASLLGSHNIKDIVKVVKQLIEGKKSEIISQRDEIKLCMPKVSQNKIIGITQILEGCLGCCSFCITRLAKGKLFSYPQEQIIKSVEADLQSGCKEIWLTSQDNAAYGLDFDSDFDNVNKRIGIGKDDKKAMSSLPFLLDKILSLPHRFFLRLGMMNPNNVLPVLDELIECYKNKKMYKFLHLPLQSCSDKILKDMNRKYKVEDFTNIVNKFRKESPDITLSTDIIVGYPTETDKDFAKTLDVIKKIRPDIINISRFWKREKTRAALLKELPLKKVKKRVKELSELSACIALEKNKRLVGKSYRCLVNKKGYADTLLARNENYKLIAIKATNLLGKFVNIKIADAKSHYLAGKIANNKIK